MDIGSGNWRGLRPGLVIGMGVLLAAQALLLAAVAAPPAGAAGIVPPADPPSNITFDVTPPCTVNGDTSAACNDTLLHDINAGRHDEGLSSMVLPSGFAQMSVAEQLLVLVNLERGSRGLSQFAGLSSSLDAAALVGAQANTDPSPPSGYPFVEWGSNFADSINPLEADFLWMYDDGMGGTNIDCQAGGVTTGCWGHRNNILWPWPGGTPTAMGASDLNAGIFTEIFVNKTGAADAAVDPYDTVTYPSEVAAPQVVQIAPTGSTAPGTGTTVTIDGNYFSAFSDGQVPTVDFGSTPATDVHVNWDGQLTTEAPADPDGDQADTVPVTVTTPAGTSSPSVSPTTDEFTYSPAPTPAVTAVTPSSGPASGGTRVTITGTGFDWTSAVDFGSTPSTSFTVTSATSITATAPASAAGEYYVTVTTSGGGPSFPSGSATFTYKLDSTTTATVSTPSALQSTAVTYGAAVTGSGRTPTGTVTFSTGLTALCTTGTLVNGTGSCSATTAPPGSDSVTATYSGDGTFAPSTGTVSLLVTSGPYSPLSPVRICDTRAGNLSGLTGAAAQCNGTANAGGTIAAGGTATINVAGSFGVPADATAVVLNVTAVNPAGPGQLVLYPAGAARPLASDLNYTAGSVVPNLVEVGIGSAGRISIYSLARSDVVVDLEGYTAPSAAGGAGAGLYVPLSASARLCDTRAGNPSSLIGGDAQCNGGTGQTGTRLGAGGTISVQVATNNGIPAGATAAVLNVTAVNPAAAGFLTVYAQGSNRPGSSNVNYTAGQTTGNRVVVALSSTGTVPGAVSVYSTTATDVVVDVSGYYTAADGAGSQFVAEPAPVRICDTRTGNPSDLSGAAAQCNGSTLGPGRSMSLDVVGLAGVPTGAAAVVVNLTAVTPTLGTYLTVFPGTVQPYVSDLNPAAGAVKGNMTVAALSPGGTISVSNHTGSVDIVVDVLGWYT